MGNMYCSSFQEKRCETFLFLSLSFNKVSVLSIIQWIHFINVLCFQKKKILGFPSIQFGSVFLSFAQTFSFHSHHPWLTSFTLLSLLPSLPHIPLPFLLLYSHLYLPPLILPLLLTLIVLFFASIPLLNLSNPFIALMSMCFNPHPFPSFAPHTHLHACT